jgi:hypothetical protein
MIRRYERIADTSKLHQPRLRPAQLRAALRLLAAVRTMIEVVRVAAHF